ncbi:hypothetical protein GLAREA_11606 [Glarea lozoyensis ATCC 20868]|uniref:Concanavalin A-like lectins/glucanase n=1 Tax=Glarea lozoyensis (strain ATCC 20868 / MF5171) TaxID=1116229 RepID=S3CGJ7_GLAL2|nr:uncharacterized protein GLAREA_11606 [Glarea lozoyensis ATCC 20868]EPE25025.1 hypothetical protein GLAREA_11606 [Glarea lozoyensis ATCC 20868]
MSPSTLKSSMVCILVMVSFFLSLSLSLINAKQPVVLLEIPPDVQDYFKQALVFQTHPGSTAAISQTFRDGSQASMLSRTSSETAELATFRDVLDVEFPFQPQVAATSNTLQWQNVADGVHIAMAHSNVSFDQASGGDGGEMQFGLWSSEWYKATRVLDGKIQCI